MKSLFLLATVVVAASQPTVNINGLGSVMGKETTIKSVQVEEYLGIKYATAGRWEAPIPTPSWNGTINATSFGSTCPGSDCVGFPNQDTEDCLYLNVYRATPTNGSALKPVMFWIHGGGYDSGCSNIYPGSNLVSTSNGDVIVVTINYRLNAFGFLGSHEMQMRSADSTTGNFGIQDQRSALQWVNKHISSFGGDPTRVTIFGQSAGAGSVTCHLVSELSKGLFQRVIAESGFGSMWNTSPMKDAQLLFDKLTVFSNCSSTDINCLKALSQQRLLQFVAEVGFSQPLNRLSTSVWGPVEDGVEFQFSTFGIIQRKLSSVSNVSILIGTNRDETGYFLYDTKTTMTPTQLTALMVGYLPSISGAFQINKLYSTAEMSYPTDLDGATFTWWQFMRLSTDHDYTCPVRRTAKAYSQISSNIYTYFFVHPTTTKTNLPCCGQFTDLVPHRSDVPYVWNCADMGTNCSFANPQETKLASDMSGAWINFAKTGNPSITGWMPYDPLTDTHFQLDVDQQFGGSGMRTVSSLRSAQCGFWDANMPPSRQ
eukprot:TRINITY_DN2337_c2_g1_i1.p1 TRINITY_DN2337_c2_g1~~TRINITY_DN2337_c2_g1_i1.p1  ORF type:complete len:559 (+),score=111.12 TRINITY_DN2337_c2_g1_i1:55-1677(+)